jgi:hypothetical protein
VLTANLLFLWVVGVVGGVGVEVEEVVVALE